MAYLVKWLATEWWSGYHSQQRQGLYFCHYIWTQTPIKWAPQVISWQQKGQTVKLQPPSGAMTKNAELMSCSHRCSWHGVSAQGNLCLCILNTEREVSFSQNGTCWHNTDISHFYSGSRQFESWLRHWLYWLRIFIAFLHPISLASTLKYVYNSKFPHLVLPVHNPVISSHQIRIIFAVNTVLNNSGLFKTSVI